MQVGSRNGQRQDKLGLELGCGGGLPGFASADQTHERKHLKHEPWCWHGEKGQICHSGAGEHPWVTGTRWSRTGA